MLDVSLSLVVERLRWLASGTPPGERPHDRGARVVDPDATARARRTLDDAVANPFENTTFADASAACGAVLTVSPAARAHPVWVVVIAALAAKIFLWINHRLAGWMLRVYGPKLTGEAVRGGPSLRVVERIQRAWLSFSRRVAVAALASYTVVGTAVAGVLDDARVAIVAAGLGMVAGVSLRVRMALVDPTGFVALADDERAWLHASACHQSVIHRLTHGTALLGWARGANAPIAVSAGSLAISVLVLSEPLAFAFALAFTLGGVALAALRYHRWLRRLPAATDLAQGFYRRLLPDQRPQAPVASQP